MRRLVLAAMMVGVAHGALAADLPDLPVLRGFLGDTPRNARTNWQGFYVGAQAGFGNADMNFANTNNGLITLVTANPIIQQLQFPPFPPLGRVSTSKSTGFGGFLGYNGQWDDAVVGLDISYLHATVKGAAMADFETVNQQGATFTDTHTDSAASLTLTDFGSMRIRGGWAIGSFLPYAFGGIGLGVADITRRISVTQTVNKNGVITGPTTIPWNQAQSSHFVSGYSFGVGLDTMLLANLFLRLEYEYLRVATAVDVNVNTVRAGLGYKF
jgi:opacity protein-like surface antigen